MSIVIDDIRQLLIDQNLVTSNRIFGYEMPDTNITGNDYNITILSVNEIPNPRYARNEVTITIQALGSSRANMRLTQSKIEDIFKYLLGHPTIYIGDNSYYNFNSTVAPRLVGYKENSKPLFTCSLSLVRESQVDEGNRETIC